MEVSVDPLRSTVDGLHDSRNEKKFTPLLFLGLREDHGVQNVPLTCTPESYTPVNHDFAQRKTLPTRKPTPRAPMILLPVTEPG